MTDKYASIIEESQDQGRLSAVKPTREELKMIEDRISELNGKFSQVLLFLSFAIVGVATLSTIQNLQPSEIGIYGATLNWWKTALLPTVIGVASVKELFPDHLIHIRTSKIALLWLAIFVIGGGVLVL